MDSVPTEQDRQQETVRGELGLGTLPALIRALYEQRRTGTLHISAGGTSRRVYFQRGAVVFAESDRTEDHLDQRLLVDGLADLPVTQRARELQESSGKRFGECLIALSRESNTSEAGDGVSLQIDVQENVSLM